METVLILKTLISPGLGPLIWALTGPLKWALLRTSFPDSLPKCDIRDWHQRECCATIEICLLFVIRFEESKMEFHRIVGLIDKKNAESFDHLSVKL